MEVTEVDRSDFLCVAKEEFQTACAAAQGCIGFAETASAVRSQMRSATACLIRFAVLSARSRREAVGQLHFDWEGARRGDQPSAIASA